MKVNLQWMLSKQSGKENESPVLLSVIEDDSDDYLDDNGDGDDGNASDVDGNDKDDD